MKRKKHASYTSNYSLHNRVRLVHGGKEFFSLAEQLINQAKSSIHFQTYIFDEDETGNFITEALINAAKRNVDVWLLADGFASQGLSKVYIDKLQQAGIHFRFFEPLLKSEHFYFGRRLHQKVIVVDAMKAIVGSMNISNRYNDLSGSKAWCDYAIYAEGEVCADLYKGCCRLWTKKRSFNFKSPSLKGGGLASIPEKEYCMVRVRRNDWVKRKNEIASSYSHMFRTAQKSISIVCSYFLPGKTIQTQLKRAVRRGVKVKVVLAGLSDVKSAKWAERYLYRWMLRHKIEVYEYQPTVLHAKMAVADGQLFTIGSYNLNGLSHYASIELNLEIKNELFASQMEKEIDAIIEKDCKKIDLVTYKIPLFSPKQFLHWASYHVIHLILRLSTFYFKQKE